MNGWRAWGLAIGALLVMAPSGWGDVGTGPSQGPVKFHTTFAAKTLSLRSPLVASVTAHGAVTRYTATVFVTVPRAASDPVRSFTLKGQGRRLAIPLSAAARARIAAAVRRTGQGAVLHVHIKGLVDHTTAYGFDQVGLTTRR